MQKTLQSVILLTLFIPTAHAAPPTDADLAAHLLKRGFSHIAPHLNPALLPAPHLPLEMPPQELLVPLCEGSEAVIKGWDTEAEQVLARALLSLPLRQRLLRVAVASAGGTRMCLIKYQAGDALTGEFRINDIQEDAVSSLQVAFRLPLGLERVDLWSVVPGRNGDEEVHDPVFSLSAGRREFEAANHSPKPARDILSGLGLIRFTPQYLAYAGGRQAEDIKRYLPATAWNGPAIRDNWEQMLLSAQQDPRLHSAKRARVVFDLPSADRREVALTIDDGPNPLVTSLFLEILRLYNVKATFFVVGEMVEKYPELLRRIAEEGHEIGNHTYHHPRLSAVPAAEALAEIRACSLAVGRITGMPTQLLRPPGGRLSGEALRAATAANTTVVMWTNNAHDWLKPPPEVIAENILRDLKPGGIMLMHQGDICSVEALPLIIEGVHARGMRFATVGEMLSRSPVEAMPIADILARQQKTGSWNYDQLPDTGIGLETPAELMYEQ